MGKKQNDIKIKARQRTSKLWVYIPASLFFILCSCVWNDLFNITYTKICILALFLSYGTVVTIIQYNYGRWPVTVSAALTGFGLILLTLNIYTPAELAKKIENGIQTKLEYKLTP